MKRILISVVLLLVAGAVSAAAYTSAGNTFRSSGGGSVYTGSSGTVSGGVASTIESVNVGGRYIGVPFIGPIAATAAEVIIGVAQRSPAAVAISVAPWLITKGIEYVNGQWMKKEIVPPSVYPPGQSTIPIYDCWGRWSSVSECAAHIPGYNGSYSLSCGGEACAIISGQTGRALCPSFWTINSSATLCTSPDAKPSCPDGYTAQPDGSCASPYVPTTESDWAKFRGEIPPDQVLNDLCKKLAEGCNVSKVSTTGGIGYLSDWVQDAPGGQWTRQVATVSPAPSPDDPERVSVTTSTETKPADTPVDSTGKPVDNGTSGTKTPDQNTDFCVLHPDSIACSKLGDPPDVPDLENRQKQLSITPDAGWGPDNGSCPADLTYTTHGGLVARFSYAPVCQAATTFRPVVIGLAWISAVLIFLGVSRRANG